MNWQGKRYWLVGASAGLGKALAQAMAAKGAKLILSARSEEPLQELAQEIGGAEVVTVDVRDTESVKAAAEAAGEVDGVIFLAGVYWPMAAQDWDAEKVEAMADIDYTGAIRVLGQVVPQMVARDRGHIVLTGSLSAFRGLPGSIGYSASKAGVKSLAESMRCDLHKTGVRVQLANPGFIRTRLTDQNDFAMPQIMEPEEAADHMMRLMENERRFESSFPVPFAWVFRAAQVFPDWLYFRIFG